MKTRYLEPSHEKGHTFLPGLIFLITLGVMA